MEYEEYLERAKRTKLDIAKSRSKQETFYKIHMFDSDEEWQKFRLAMINAYVSMKFSIEDINKPLIGIEVRCMERQVASKKKLT